MRLHQQRRGRLDPCGGELCREKQAGGRPVPSDEIYQPGSPVYLDKETITKQRFYKYIYKNKLLASKKLLTRIKNHYEGSDHAVEECRKYLTGNWAYIQRAFRDKHVLGCSAEGHVSSVYSERMSSRPMGWSETGTDRMCKLRCFIRNYGREKVIDLVNYRRERELSVAAATGTNGMIDESSGNGIQQSRKRLSDTRRHCMELFPGILLYERSLRSENR